MRRSRSLDEILSETLPPHETPLAKVFLDKSLARLGDALINFLYSLALTQKGGEPLGVKVSNQILSEAVRGSGLRESLPSRLTRHEIGGAAEALILYAIAQRRITVEECLSLLRGEGGAVDAFTSLLTLIKERFGDADSGKV